MKKILLSTVLVVLSSLTSFGQIINDAANWPNAGWTLTGTHNAGFVLGNPSIDPNFGYNDDGAGSGSTDILIATSPVIDITAAQATEPSLFVDYAYDYNLGGTFDLEYFDADLATWVVWNALPDNSASESGYCAAIGAGTTSNSLDISGFTANQLTNFQYRFNYNASSTWGWGFCMSSPTLYSVGCLPATGLGAPTWTYTTADLTWDAIGGAVGYNIEWGAPGFTPGTATELGSDVSGTNSVQATGLTANTSYEFYVQTDCGGSQSTWAGPYTFFTGYCTPSSGSDICFINYFSWTGGLGNISNLATGFTAGGYADYTAQFLKGTAGSSFNFNGAIVGGTVGFAIWIDWNNDLVFDNATEKFFNTTGYGNGPFTGTINIPALQADGDYRMRVTTDWNASNPSNPCAAASRAEFEDYIIRVVTQPAEPDTPFEIAGTPDCVVGTQIDIATTPVDPNVTWYWQTVNNGTSTANPFTGPFTVMNNGTVYVNAYNSLSDVWSATSDSIVITSIPSATPPPAPVADANPACNSTQLNVAAAPMGYEYYWQGTNATGISTAEPATAPYDVTATGTYYVSAFETATQCWSDGVGTAVVISNVVPNDPVVSTPVNVCSTVTTIPLNATITPLTYTYTVNMDDSFGDGWNGNTLNIFVDGAPVLNATFTTGFSATATFDVQEGQTITSTWTNGSFIGECSFEIENELGIVIHAGVSTDMINYTLSANTYSLEWYDAPGGNLLGTGSPFEAVGTSVIPTVAVGNYDFFVVQSTGCQSNAIQVTVNISDVLVELTPIDATCNNQANGSFSVTNTICGMPPFSYSIDGGAFGSIPTDLLPGTYDVVLQDMNNDLSATYTLVIGDALPPSLVYMETIEDDGGQVSWTANGTESQWYVEWGLPGFTPGTGTEIGSADALDTFFIITGLDENTNYDVYVSANCGAGETVGTWVLVNFTTACGVYGIPFVETFEDDSETRVCWENQQEAGSADWTYDTGSSLGAVTTAYEGTLNARFVSQSPSGGGTPVTKLVSPRFDFAGQDSVALVFAYAQEVWFTDQNITKVYVASQTSAWTEIQSYNNNVDTWTLDTLFLSDTVYQVAFEGTNNWGHANVIDDVQFLPCTLVPGVDGSMDVCRADGTINLNSVITAGENFGKWSFSNPTFIVNDSIAQIGLLPAGTHEFYYIVETPCAADTTVAYVTVFNASSAGIDGTINVCRNEPFDLLSGLGGNVDLGGTWYDPSNNPIASSQLMASNIPGQFNYDYIVSNGVCGPDTANVVVNVSPTCDWLNIAELGLEAIELYPNPTSGMIYITNEGSTEVFSYELTDLNGKVITSAANAINGTDTTPVDLSKLEPGVYLIKVANDNVEHTFRVIKQ